MKTSSALSPVRFSAEDFEHTPAYVYSTARLEELWSLYHRHCSFLQCHYAMKANAHPEILRFMRAKGAGVDIVSGGEIKLAQNAQFHSRQIIFSGVGKSEAEINLALQADIRYFNVESEAEALELETSAAARKQRARILFRLNPNVDAKTHPNISTGLREHKFGMNPTAVISLAERLHKSAHLEICGLSLHIGSQIGDLSAIGEAIQGAKLTLAELQRLGAPMQTLDIGGGLKVNYESPDTPPDFAAYGKLLHPELLALRKIYGEDFTMITEIGRALTAQSGFLLSKVIRTKTNGQKHFAIIDASMTELIRPMLYQAWHPITTLSTSTETQSYDIVGPVCESSDTLAKNRTLPLLKKGDPIIIGCAGAYGAAMASTYNSRPLPPERFI